MAPRSALTWGQSVGNRLQFSDSAEPRAHWQWVFLSWKGQSPPAGRNSTLLENCYLEWELMLNFLAASEFLGCLCSVVTQRHWPHCPWGEFGESQGVSTTLHSRTQNLGSPKSTDSVLKIPKIAQIDFYYKLSNNFWINDTNWNKSI